MTSILMKLVDLSALAADFDLWSDIAEREPIFITRDGCQEFVLMLVGFYDQLLAPASAARSGAAD